jgi:hypothetical protein
MRFKIQESPCLFRVLQGNGRGEDEVFTCLQGLCREGAG